MSILPDWNKAPYSSKLFIVIGCILVCSVFMSIVSIIIIKVILAIPFDQVNLVLTQNSMVGHVTAIKVFQAFSSVGIFLLPAIVVPFIFKQSAARFLQCVPISQRYYIIGLTIGIVLIPIVNVLVHLNQQMSLPDFLSGIEQWMFAKEKAAAEITERIMQMYSAKDLGINLLIVAILPAIAEEFLFRGVIQKMLSEWFKNIHLAILCTAIVFSALHLQFYGFFPRMLLGVLLGYAMYWSGSIWFPVWLHFLNNAMSVLAEYAIQHSWFSIDLNTLGTHTTWYLNIVAVPVLVFLLRRLYTKHQNKLMSEIQ